jgi:hypothetical protein
MHEPPPDDRERAPRMPRHQRDPSGATHAKRSGAETRVRHEDPSSRSKSSPRLVQSPLLLPQTTEDQTRQDPVDLARRDRVDVGGGDRPVTDPEIGAPPGSIHREILPVDVHEVEGAPRSDLPEDLIIEVPHRGPQVDDPLPGLRIEEVDLPARGRQPSPQRVGEELRPAHLVRRGHGQGAERRARHTGREASAGLRTSPSLEGGDGPFHSARNFNGRNGPRSVQGACGPEVP